MDGWVNGWMVGVSMRFSRQGYSSGLPFSSPGDLANPGMELWSLALQADSLLTEPLGKPPKSVERCAYVRNYYYLVRGTQESRSISVVCVRSTTDVSSAGAQFLNF